MVMVMVMLIIMMPLHYPTPQECNNLETTRKIISIIIITTTIMMSLYWAPHFKQLWTILPVGHVAGRKRVAISLPPPRVQQSLLSSSCVVHMPAGSKHILQQWEACHLASPTPHFQKVS